MINKIRKIRKYYGTPPKKNNKQELGNKLYLIEMFFVFEQKLVKISQQYATLWNNNEEYWFFYASTSWDCACEPLQTK